MTCKILNKLAHHILVAHHYHNVPNAKAHGFHVADKKWWVSSNRDDVMTSFSGEQLMFAM